MKYLSEYRNKDIIKSLSQKIAEVSKGKNLTFMEVCGTHTMAIAKFGIKELLPENVNLISGPGCPVCVTPNRYLDHVFALSKLDNTIITTFGDMMRVPGSTTSLEREKAKGNSIKIVYSPIDALELAENNPDKEVIFLSVGFETTIPTIASTLLMAEAKGIENFSILTANKVVPPALEALLQGDLALNGFLLPGHVSAIIGGKAYIPTVEKYKVASSIAGFEPTDILESVLDLVLQSIENHPELSIKYRRVVNMEGNNKAQDVIEKVFKPCDAEWRGIGVIPGSGLDLNEKYSKFDAAKKFSVEVEETKEEKGCQCGSILQGLINPTECPLFGKKCTPENPVGACMVSSEGTCAAWYKYRT